MATVNPLDAAREAHVESGARFSAQLANALRIIGAALLAALLVRAFIVQPFSIPSGSMGPGLKAGDYILVDKAAYGWSLASLPFGLSPPGVGGEATGTQPARIMPRAPRTGDVIVFVGPGGSDYVKRVIARGGDRVAMEAGRVRLNGVLLPCLSVDSAVGKPADRLCREMLPGGRGHLVFESGAAAVGDMPELRVPEGRYFVLGDNRGHSADSRIAPVNGGVGLVADSQVIGRAQRIFLSLGDGLRWDRMGREIE